MNQQTEIEIVEPCGHSKSGTWSLPSTGEKGFICWDFEHGTGTKMVPWPETLLCRYCNKEFTKDQVQKKWLQPVYYSDKDHTFNCGCSYIDSSD